MIKQQAFIMPFENMFTHQTNILIFAHHPEAEPRGILLIKYKMEVSNEQKIKEAAKTVFYKRGVTATRTRDIAEEAGLNLALLNYYFRSKA